MEIIRKIPKLLMMICALSVSFQAFSDQNVSVNMRILIISPKAESQDSPNLEIAKDILRGFQIPFDTLILANNKGQLYNSGRLNLETTDKAGKYYGIIFTDQNLIVKTKNSQFPGLNSGQLSQLSEYERKYNVRRISLNSDPALLPGLSTVGAAGDASDTLLLNQDFAKLDSSLPRNLEVSLNYSWHSKARINNNYAHKAFAYYGNYVSGEVGRAVAATVFKINDGREQLHLFYSQGKEQASTYALAPAWISWLTRGTFLGKRRVYLNVHIDDLFLDTDMNTTSKSPYSYKKYRMSAYDLEHFANQRSSEIKELTYNPEYRIEYAFNGQGIFENGGYAKDQLYLAAKRRSRDYYWVSHTYTHRDLNKIKFKDADRELSNNIIVSKGLMNGAWEYFSPHSMVTPHISGLYNRHALEAMKKNGIFHIVNDMSIIKQRPTNAHTAYYTTSAVNGSDGVLIMPRYATDIYYDTSIPEEITDVFNSIHGGVFKRRLYFEDIFKMENERNINFLLNYQSAAYMFHQANMRVFNYNGNSDSLVSLWIKRTLTEFRKYSSLPILSVKMDDLADLYLNRMAISSCGQNGRVIYKNGELSRVMVWAKGNCKLSLTSQVTEFQNENAETYGPDKTVNINVQGSYFKSFQPTEKISL